MRPLTYTDVKSSVKKNERLLNKYISNKKKKSFEEEEAAEEVVVNKENSQNSLNE